MKKKILTKETTVVGPSFLGNQSSLTFLPAGKPGWYLRTQNNGDVPIDFRITYSKKGRLQLKAGGTTLNVIEHILALKMLIGLDQVILISHYTWPPYLGGAGGYAKQLEGAWEQTNDEFRSIEPNREYNQGKGDHRLAQVILRKNAGLSIVVHSQWDPLPSGHRIINNSEFLSDDFVKKVLDSKPQGFPHNRRRIAILLSKFGWPNLHNISWLADFKKNRIKASEAWVDHAVQDTLGALALCHHEMLPQLYYYRWRAGHRHDLECIKNAFE